jgi:hypothetical protein
VEELYVIRINMGGRVYDKSLNLDNIKESLEIAPYHKSYDDYVKPGLLYFTQNLKLLAKELGVLRVVPMGLYIRGIYGGEEKKGEKQYAGLTLEQYSSSKGVFRFKLYNTTSILVTPQTLLDDHGVKVYKMIYMGEVNPFRLKRFLNIILSRSGMKMLKRFLEKAIALNIRSVSSDDIEKIKALISELKQPSKIDVLTRRHYYVAYRRIRAFTAFAFKPSEDDIIIKDEVGYLKCEFEDIAYYYAAILNYLAYKVIEFGKVFNRTQYAKPLLALHFAGLSWRTMKDGVRKKIVELSKILHDKAPSKDYSNQKIAIEDIYNELPEFKDLIKLIDGVVDKERLKDALNLVSGTEE